MTTTIGRILPRRSDLSTFLVHLTRNKTTSSAKDVLKKIIEDNRLIASSPFGQAHQKMRAAGWSVVDQMCVCFTEVPMEHICLLTENIEGRAIKMEPYGIAVTKKHARKKDVNPVWYLDQTVGREWLSNPLNKIIDSAIAEDSKDASILKLSPFIEQFGHYKDFYWEREWRCIGDFHLPARYLRSGAGAHVWIFFDMPVRAALARSLGAFLISETKQNRYQLGFKSYDRMFPNQDTMPRGGFGNLIALPLQLEPSRTGNSVFVDRSLQPFEDQWTYLAAIVRMRAADLESIVRDAAAREAIVTVPLSSDDADSEEPWKRKPSEKPLDLTLKEPYPRELSLVISNMIYFAKEGFSSAALSKLMGLAAFQNPEFYQKQATRQSTHDTPRVICCTDDLPKHLALPRGCLDSLKELLVYNRIAITVTDERCGGIAIEADFKGQLRDEQPEAAKQILSSDLGILSASTAFGKTVVASYIIGKRKTNTLILVHTLPLIDQWKERLEQFLDMPPKSIGQIGGGKKKRTGIVDIATIQSLGRKGVVSDFVAEYGQLIVDECHHISAFSFEQVVKQAKAKYVLGLTATPVRKDGHQPIIMMQCGAIRFKDSLRNRKLISGVKHVVIPRETGFQMPPSSQDGTHIHELYDALANNEVRNELIFNDILRELDQGRSPLVITERLEHLDELAARLQGFAKNIIVLKGGMTKKERAAIFAKLKAIPDDSERLILATGKYIGEGFDDSRLDTLFLLLPISFEGRVEQYAGRLHREHAAKTDVRIYDYLDSSHPILKKMFERRCVKYRKLGYEIAKSH